MAKPFSPKPPEPPGFVKGTPKPIAPKGSKKGGKKAPKPPYLTC